MAIQHIYIYVYIYTYIYIYIIWRPGRLRTSVKLFLCCSLLRPAETARVSFGENLQTRRRKTSKAMDTGHSSEANNELWMYLDLKNAKRLRREKRNPK